MKRPLALAVLPLCLVLVAAPAQAEQRLQTRPACGGVAVAGSGFPEPVALLMVTDVRSGRRLAGPLPVRTDPDGSFQARLAVDLRGRRTVEVTAWRKAGTTVIMTAKRLVDRPCVAAAGGALPLTGPRTRALLSVGLSLVALGALLRYAARYRGRHQMAAGIDWLAPAGVKPGTRRLRWP